MSDIGSLRKIQGIWLIGLAGLVGLWLIAGMVDTDATGDFCRKVTDNPTDYNKCLIMVDNE